MVAIEKLNYQNMRKHTRRQHWKSYTTGTRKTHTTKALEIIHYQNIGNHTLSKHWKSYTIKALE